MSSYLQQILYVVLITWDYQEISVILAIGSYAFDTGGLYDYLCEEPRCVCCFCNQVKGHFIFIPTQSCDKMNRNKQLVIGYALLETEN